MGKVKSATTCFKRFFFYYSRMKNGPVQLFLKLWYTYLLLSMCRECEIETEYFSFYIYVDRAFNNWRIINSGFDSCLGLRNIIWVGINTFSSKQITMFAYIFILNCRKNALKLWRKQILKTILYLAVFLKLIHFTLQSCGL